MKAGSENATDITPEAGWEPVSKYGAMVNSQGVKLVRLEDVFDWMHARGIAAHPAIYKIFGPFYEACLQDDPIDLEILHAVDFPTPLSVKRRVRPSEQPQEGPRHVVANDLRQTRSLLACLPDLGHIRFESGSPGSVVYALGEAARRVWRGKADVSTDPLYRHEAQKEEKAEAEYGIRWPRDEVLRLVLARVAVPIATAHTHWGWGSVAGASDEGAESPSAEVVPLVAVPVSSDWVRLIAERRSTDEHGWAWTTERALVIYTEEARRKAVPGATGVRKQMAAEMSADSRPITPQKLFEAMREHLPPQDDRKGSGTNGRTPSL